MGYTTDLNGKWKLNKPLAAEHYAYLVAFSHTRRMKRDAALTEKLDDPIRIAAGLPIGVDAEYFVGAQDESFGQAHSPDILDYNGPPSDQPGLWCQWVPTEDAKAITWDEGEKFYDYVEWIEYIVKHFLKPWGYRLTGSVTWSGEESGDMGRIDIRYNKVRVLRAVIEYRLALRLLSRGGRGTGRAGPLA